MCLLLVVILFFVLDRINRIIQDYFLFFLTSRMEVRKLNPPAAEIKLLHQLPFIR